MVEDGSGLLFETPSQAGGPAAELCLSQRLRMVDPRTTVGPFEGRCGLLLVKEETHATIRAGILDWRDRRTSFPHRPR